MAGLIINGAKTARFAVPDRPSSASGAHSGPAVGRNCGVVEQQQLVGHGVYETIVPSRRKPFRALLYERELFADKVNGFGLVIAVDNRPLFGRVPALLEADTPAAGIPIGAPRKSVG